MSKVMTIPVSDFVEETGNEILQVLRTVGLAKMSVNSDLAKELGDAEEKLKIFWLRIMTNQLETILLTKLVDKIFGTDEDARSEVPSTKEDETEEEEIKTTV